MGRNGYTGLAVLAASLALLWGTLGLERHPMVPVGPDFYPRIVLGITALMALTLVAVDVLRHWRARPGTPARPAAAAGASYGLVVAAFGVFALYVVSLPYLGFRGATFAFLIAMQATLEWPRGARRWLLVLVIAVAATVAIHGVFEGYLQVLLPRGRWTGF